MNPRAVGLLGLLAAIVAGARAASAQTGGGGGSRPARRWRAPRVALPADYAREAVSRLVSRVDDATMRASFARWGARWMPGAPLSAVVAVSVTSMGPRERLAHGDQALGVVNIELARARTLARDATTAADLARRVDPDDRAAWERDVDAQIYMGLRGYAEELHDLARRVDVVEAHPAAWSVWDYCVAVTSYSGGPTAAEHVLSASAEDLSRVEAGAERWRSLVGEMAEWTGDVDDLARHAAWGAIRAAQRVACARELARRRPVTDQIPGWGGSLGAGPGTGPVRMDITAGWCGEDPGAATWERVRAAAYGAR